jgi:hypothetical protein
LGEFLQPSLYGPRDHSESFRQHRVGRVAAAGLAVEAVNQGNENELGPVGQIPACENSSLQSHFVMKGN